MERRDEWQGEAAEAQVVEGLGDETCPHLAGEERQHPGEAQAFELSLSSALPLLWSVDGRGRHLRRLGVGERPRMPPGAQQALAGRHLEEDARVLGRVRLRVR